MKLLKRFLQGLGNKSRPSRQVLDLLAAGRSQEARSLARQIDRNDLQEWLAIAEGAAAMGPEAEELLFLVIRNGNANYPFLLAGGRWLDRHGEPLRAFAFFSAAHRLAPAESAPLLAQGEIQSAMGNLQAAASLFASAQQREASDAPDPGRPEEALAIARASLREAPQDLSLLRLTAERAALAGDDPLAIELYRRLVAEDLAAGAGAWSNLGNSLARLEQFAEAIAPLEHAVGLAPRDVAANFNLAQACHFSGRPTQAIAALNAVLAVEQHDFEACWLRATLSLARHDFEQGWEDYEYRSVQTGVPPSVHPYPLWRGQPLDGKRLLITAEQGVGDQIMFLSCLPDLMNLCGEITVECEPRLETLFARSFPEARFIGSRPVTLWTEDFDFHLPMGSLPRVFRRNPESFAQARLPYLRPDQAKAQKVRQLLESLGDGPRIGIAWRGGVALSRTRSRTLPLSRWAAMLNLPSCHFISMQYGDCDEEIAAVEAQAGVRLHHWPEQMIDLDEFAALTSEIDLLVTVCSAPVHFAGAMGKPTIVLAPHVPEWRYVGKDGAMLWYPTVSLISQPSPGDWDPVIAETARRLSRLLTY